MDLANITNNSKHASYISAENKLSREKWIKAIEAIKNRRYSQKQLVS